MLRRLLRWPPRLLRLASLRELERVQVEAARVLAELEALEHRVSHLLDETYEEAPVIRIHHGAPPHVH